MHVGNWSFWELQGFYWSRVEDGLDVAPTHTHTLSCMNHTHTHEHLHKIHNKCMKNNTVLSFSSPPADVLGSVLRGRQSL